VSGAREAEHARDTHTQPRGHMAPPQSRVTGTARPRKTHGRLPGAATMTYVDPADLIDLLGSAIDHAAARQTLDEALAAHNWAPGARLDPADALALLAQCANRADGVGIATCR